MSRQVDKIPVQHPPLPAAPRPERSHLFFVRSILTSGQATDMPGCLITAQSRGFYL
jgi:hypothetical protein